MQRGCEPICPWRSVLFNTPLLGYFAEKSSLEDQDWRKEKTNAGWVAEPQQARNLPSLLKLVLIDRL